MRIDHTCNWAFTNMLIDQFERCPSREVARERVNDHPTFVAANECDIGNVVSTHLPHAIRNLKQPVMSIERCMAP